MDTLSTIDGSRILDERDAFVEGIRYGVIVGQRSHEVFYDDAEGPDRSVAHSDPTCAEVLGRAIPEPVTTSSLADLASARAGAHRVCLYCFTVPEPAASQLAPWVEHITWLTQARYAHGVLSGVLRSRDPAAMAMNRPHYVRMAIGVATLVEAEDAMLTRRGKLDLDGAPHDLAQQLPQVRDSLGSAKRQVLDLVAPAAGAGPGSTADPTADPTAGAAAGTSARRRWILVPQLHAQSPWRDMAELFAGGAELHPPIVRAGVKYLVINAPAGPASFLPAETLVEFADRGWPVNLVRAALTHYAPGAAETPAEFIDAYAVALGDQQPPEA